MTCGAVTVNGTQSNNGTGPALWITNSSNDQNVTSIRIRSNTGESVSYSIPAGDSSCVGNSDNASDPAFAPWSGQSVSGSGPTAFTGIPTGTYTLNFTCRTSGGGGSGSYSNVTSNNVTITASPSNIQEK